ncbi:uncharacterized protein [Aristolochia californica]|uniref:uncharacterized protein n=1 Tax=Aristolochia californica TaxID=171875 RepID=UPI0035DFE55B
MGDWRGHHRESSHQEGPNTPSRSKNRRPPSGREGSWQPSVSSWEKKFCYSNCSISWRKLLETKKLMCFYTNVVQWNDSAGEEAFRNAKARFWAELHGVPCNISLPDPDIYIDEIDWNCYIDPELLSELDQPPPPPDDEERMDGKAQTLSSGWDSYLLSDKPIVCSGWGDAEVPIKASGWGGAEEPVKPSGWGDAEEFLKPSGWGDTDKKINPTGWGGAGESVMSSGWEVQKPVTSSGWGDVEDPVNPVKDVLADSVENSWKHDQWEGDYDYKNSSSPAWKCNGWENGPMENTVWDQGALNFWGWGQCDGKVNKEDCGRRDGGIVGGTGDSYSRNRVNRNFSRYRTCRYQRDAYDYQANDNGWKNPCRGRKRVNYLHERPEIEKRPLSSLQWNSVHSCVPMTHHHHRTAEVFVAGGNEKQVS